MNAISILSFLGASMLLTFLPGPNNLFTLGESITKGKKAGFITTLGLCTGLLVHITVTIIGISSLITQSLLAFSILKYAGAVYMLFLVYQSLQNQSFSLQFDNKAMIDYKSLYKKGVILNLLNPRITLFLLSFLPKYINHENGHVLFQTIVYGLLFLLQAFILFILISFLASKLGNLLRKNPTLTKKMNYIQAGLYAVIGIQIVLS
jgi:threonine/homoserine/homoserine lactone efflux protein